MEGRFREAAALLLERGEIEHAAELLIKSGDHESAGEVFASGVASLDEMTRAERKLARKAAVCFSRARKTRKAVEYFLAVGDTERAASLLERSGDKISAAKLRNRDLDDRQRVRRTSAANVRAVSLEKAGKLDSALACYMDAGDFVQAARVQYEMGQYAEAGKLFVESGMYYQAAQSWTRARDYDSALRAYMHVTPNDPKYRKACTTAIEIASRDGSIDGHLIRFAESYVRSGPQAQDELRSFSLLGVAFERAQKPNVALSLFEAVLRFDPAFPGIAGRVSKLRDGPKQKSKSGREISITAADLSELGRQAVSESGTMSAPGVGPRGPSHSVDGPSPDSQEHPIPPAEPDGSAPDVRPGVLINGRYRIEAEVGRGGMGAVYRAHDVELEEDVALKFIETGGSDAPIERFKQELSLSRRLRHHNIVQVFDLGVWGRHRFISMEFLAGEDMGDTLQRGIPFDRAYDWLAQACAGLAAAHKRNVVHRDVKPENLFVTEAGIVKVMDFGIAKKMSAGGKKLTKSGTVAGTPDYIAPEQVRNFAEVDPKADVYSMGCIAYQVFTGSVPFETEEVYQLLYQHVNDYPPPPNEKNPEVPGELSDFIMQMMRKSPEERPNMQDASGFFRRKFEDIERARKLFQGPLV